LRNGGVAGIFILNLQDNSVRSLVEGETREVSQPAWSPNGKLIAYVNSDNRIWVMDVNGENRRSLIIGGGDYLINGPAWSADGSVVIYTRTLFSDTTGSTLLMAVPYTDSGAIPVEVPTSWFSGSHDIYIMRSNGVDRHSIDDNQAYEFDPVWRPLPKSQP
jgi:Tol biopolymer transport system component